MKFFYLAFLLAAVAIATPLPGMAGSLSPMQRSANLWLHMQLKKLGTDEGHNGRAVYVERTWKQ